ncbi:oligosaccharide flippase family protein [uncultured Psychromonas sp.]|uniref:lipopolysaccharide biosynthesis protein n=1 Tax=uncultured Psychromonas sp. TaxID=173974 RepID=UPI00260B4EAC|nr:oligosaccharide flippase family protein [uncultured Psychromonas sp.]
MSTFLKNTSVYFFANILNAAIPFMLLPVLTRYLSVEEYGQIAMFQLLIAGLAGIVGLNTVGAAGRKYYDANISRSELENYNTSCFLILLLSGIVVVLAAFTFENEIVSYLSIPSDWIYISIAVSFMSFIIQFRLSQWQIRGDSKKYGVLQVINSLFSSIFSLIFVILFSMGAQGRIDAQIITSIIISVVCLYFLLRDKCIALTLPSRQHLIDSLNFGVPLVPHVFGFFLLSSADRYIINESMGLAAAGIYMLAIQLSRVFSVIFDAINKAYVPYLFSCLKENNKKTKIKLVKYTYYYYLALIFITIFSFYTAPYALIVFVGENFKESADIIGWILVGQMFNGMYLMVTNYIFYSKETKLLSSITILSGIINIILLYLLIPVYGLKGAAFSACISMFLRFVFTWGVAAWKVDMPWLLFSVSKKCYN